MKNILIYAVLLSVMSSCTAERLSPRSDGGRISVDLKMEYETGTGTKAPVRLTGEQAAAYVIGIYDSDGTRAEYNDGNGEIPDVSYADFTEVEVALGQSYYVTAVSCTEEMAEIGNGCARFVGTSEVFTLNASNISETAEVICFQTNALVTVVFDETVSGRFSGLKVVLKSDTNTSRELTVQESDGTTGLYFNPSTVSYTVTGTYKATASIGTTAVSLKGSHTLNARDHIRLLVKLNMENGLAQVPTLSVIEGTENDADIENVVDAYDYETE